MQYKSYPYLGPTSATFYFAPFAQNDYSMLLDSGENTSNGRFSILLCQPKEVLEIKSDTQSLIHLPSNRIEKIDNYLVYLRNSIEKFEALFKTLNTHSKPISDDQTQFDPSKIPFIGGYAGVFAYDFGRHLERLPCLAKNELNIPDLVIGLYLHPIIIDHVDKTVRVFHWFSNTESDPTPAVMSKSHSLNNNHSFNTICATLDKLKPKVQPRRNDTLSVLKSEWRSNMSEKSYALKFQQVKKYITEGDCYQVNLAQRFEASFEGDEWQIFQNLSCHNNAPFSVYFKLADTHLLSFSPERFIEIKDDVIRTQPIKGTRPRHDDPVCDQQAAEELKLSEKDNAENVMIVDLLRNDIGRSALTGSVKVTELCGLHSFNSVHHLISTIEAKRPKETSPLDVFLNAFPGGSITGAPKIRSMEIIEELEPHRRHFYCGSVAYFSFNGHMDSNILIRSLISHNKHLYTWAGGGLVNDSECELEYKETFAKLSKILPTLTQVET